VTSILTTWKTLPPSPQPTRAEISTCPLPASTIILSDNSTAICLQFFFVQNSILSLILPIFVCTYHGVFFKNFCAISPKLFSPSTNWRNSIALICQFVLYVNSDWPMFMQVIQISCLVFNKKAKRSTKLASMIAGENC
jgi:hypothetical protein